MAPKWLAGIACAALLAGGASGLRTMLRAQEAVRVPTTRSAASAVAPRTVRLNFFNQTWAEVLDAVAIASGSQLSMEAVPPGRVTRRDFRLYTRSEAVEILNRDLQRLGYRLVENGRQLNVVSLSERAEAARGAAYAVGQVEPRRVQLASGISEAGHPAAPALSAAGISEWQGAAGAQPADSVQQAPIQLTPPQLNAPASGQQDRLPQGNPLAPHASDPLPIAANTTEQAASSNEPQRLQFRGSAVAGAAGTTAVQGGPGSPPAVPEKTHQRIAVRKRTATEVAKSIYLAFPKRAQLVDAGPAGLPAFVVYQTDGTHDAANRADQLVDFAVGIDQQREELVIEAPKERAAQIGQLVQLLDTPVTDQQTTRFYPLRLASRQMANTLQKIADHVVGQVRLAQLPPVAQQAPQQPLDQLPQFPEEFPEAIPQQPQVPGQVPPNVAQPPADQVPPAEQPGEAPVLPRGLPLQLNLLGPVTIRDVPGVGLVVTGNQEDVEAVMAAVRILELQAQGAAADIHLLMLLHVNSEALAELLNTVYQTLTEIRQPLAGQAAQTVRIIPVVKPNAILILAPEYEMQAVLELAERLDQPVSPETEFEVFRLESAVATQVVTAIETFYATRPPLGARVVAIADVRTNSVIVQARGRDLEEVARLIESLDQGTSQSVNRIRILPLEYATAAELSNVIMLAIQGVLQPPQQLGIGGQFGGVGVGGIGGQIPQELQTARSVILELMAAEGEVDQLIRSGVLSDIRVTPDAARNALIVTAPPQSMDLVVALVDALDRPSPLVADIKVITLANSDANLTAALLQELFQTNLQPAGAAGQVGGQVFGAEDAGSGLIPLRISVDTRTNSVIVSGSPDMLRIVEAILFRLDTSDIRQRQNIVMKLQNTPATDVSLALNQFLTAQRQLATLDPELITSLELLEREVIVVPEPITNSLLVSATPRYFDEIVRMVRTLDQKPPEVVIQALLVEVVLDNTDEFGVELGGQDPVLFDRSVDGVPGFNFNNSPLGNDVTVSPGTVASQLLSDVGLGRLNPDLGFGGLVLSASSESLSVLIRALSAKRTVHILSRPTIRTLDNQPALIHVGSQVPIVTGANVTGLGVVQPTITQQQIGIILTVTPRISPDGSIVMETIATKSSLSPVGVPIITDPGTGATIESPVIDITNAQATISVPNAQTVVLGGMITKQDNAFERKVPWLGDLPVIGHAFRYDQVTTQRTELLIFLTPRVIRNDADSELIKRVEAERLHFIEKDAEDVHGPLYSGAPLGAGFLSGEDGLMDQVPCLDESNVPTGQLPSPDLPVIPIPQSAIESQQTSAVDLNQMGRRGPVLNQSDVAQKDVR